MHNFCNLTCSYCPNKDMKRKREFMSDEVFHTILHKYVVPFKDRNCFCPPTFICHKDGETLLDRKLPDRLRDIAVCSPDMSIDIYSHGLLLPKWAERGQDFFEFLASLPNRVRYLMSYHPYNHDGSNNNYIPTMGYMHRVLRMREQGHFQNIEFITVSHKSKWVTQEMQDFWKCYWFGLPITVHCNASLNPWTGLITEEGAVQFNGCPYADFGHYFFGVTGNVIACCLDLEEEIILGNVLRDDPAEMFARTEAFYAEQRRILAAKELHPRGVCRDCFGQKRDAVSELLQLGVPA